MAEQPELTLEDLLREPIILKLMERDGYRPDDIRTLARQAVARGVQWESRRVTARWAVLQRLDVPHLGASAHFPTTRRRLVSP